MEESVLFIHIPKTAGTSLYYNFYHQYRLFEFFHFLDHQHGDLSDVPDKFRQQDFENLPSWLKERIRVYGGHMPYGLHQAIQAPCRYVAFFREPVSRIISTYTHIYHHAHHPAHKQLHQEKITLWDFVKNERFPEGQNLMTRMLAGTLKPMEADEALYQKAMHNILDSQMIVGLQEDFDNSIGYLAHRLGWKKPVLRIHANIKQVELETPAPELLEWIRVRNQYDLKLYNEIRQIFTRQVENNKTAIEKMKSQMVRPNKKIYTHIWLRRKLVRLGNLWIGWN